MNTLGGSTALMIACDSGHVDTVKLLLSKGANVFAKDVYANTPLHRMASIVAQNSQQQLFCEITRLILMNVSEREDEKFKSPKTMLRKKKDENIETVKRRIQEEMKNTVTNSPNIRRNVATITVGLSKLSTLNTEKIHDTYDLKSPMRNINSPSLNHQPRRTSLAVTPKALSNQLNIGMKPTF